jgi:hypothetical protein
MQPNSGRPPANVIVEVPSQIPLPQRLGEGGRDVRIPSANLFPRRWLFIYWLFIARGLWAEALEGSRQDRPDEIGCLPGPDLM